jgi:hypothetical protein
VPEAGASPSLLLVNNGSERHYVAHSHQPGKRISWILRAVGGTVWLFLYIHSYLIADKMKSAVVAALVGVVRRQTLSALRGSQLTPLLTTVGPHLCNPTTSPCCSTRDAVLRASPTSSWSLSRSARRANSAHWGPHRDTECTDASPDRRAARLLLHEGQLRVAASAPSAPGRAVALGHAHD